MPSKSRAVKRVVKPSRSYAKFGRKVATISGQPGVQVVQQTFPATAVIRPAFTQARVRMLHKVDVSKGITMPNAQGLPFVAGVVKPGQGSGGVRIVRQHPIVPVAQTGTGNGRKVAIAAPSPTNRGGIRNPYRKTQRVGSTGKSTRYR